MIIHGRASSHLAVNVDMFAETSQLLKSLCDL